jgi:PAS domain S-box-containing protein
VSPERDGPDPELDDRTLRLLMRSVVGYAIYFLDVEGRVRSWNPGAERIKGYSAEEILGKHYEVFFTPEARAAGEPEEHLRRARVQPHESTGWRVRKSGERFWASLTLTPLYADGTLRGYAKVTRDLTDLKRAEEERLRLSRAEEALRLRDEFLHRANQGLDRILSTIRVHLRTLTNLLGSGPRPAPISARLASIESTLQRVDSMAENVLQLAADTGERLVRRARRRDQAVP